MLSVPQGQAAVLLGGDFQSLGMGLYRTQAILNTSVHSSKVLFFPTLKTKMFYGQIQAGSICVILHSAHFWPKSPFKCCIPQITELLLGMEAFSFV